MVIVFTAEKLVDLPEGNEGYSLVAKRIEFLVQNGGLLAQGDITKWRHSEVCLLN